MNDSANKFLLSMLLAIKELEAPLNSEEKERLKNAAQQLSFVSNYPTSWETHIEPNLLEIINNNSSLNKLFQDIKSKLDKIDHIPQDLIPTAEDLATVIPTKNQPQERSLVKTSPADLKSNEITNMSIEIISSPEPSETVKKIGKLEKLWNFITPDNSEIK